MPDLALLLAQAALSGQRGDLPRARELYAAALAASPGHPAARFGLAQVALAQGDLHAAAAALSELATHDDPALREPLARAFAMLAHALRKRGARDGAVAAFDQVVRLEPGSATAWLDLGSACMEAAQGQVDRAQAGATSAPPAYDALRGAVAAFTRASALEPGSAAAAAARAMAARHAGAFAEADAATATLEALAARPGFACEPMAAVTLFTSPAFQRAGIEGYVRSTQAGVPASAALVATRGTRLRVGYLSSDFHDHATAHLAAGMFEAHDRARVEAFAYATDRDDGSAMRARLRGAFEHWRDLRSLDDAQAAATIARDGLDVLVDLKGHTQGARLSILARRPAPVQVHYLGFPGTLGWPGVIDAFVADDITAPAGAEHEFGEALVRLPVCYQVNDRRRVLPPRASRAAAGLPDDAIVLACLNQTVKLTRRFFEAWLAVLREIPATILWLAAPHALARRNLLEAAAQAGIAADRIVFAPVLPQAAHLSRLQCADLALDVLPYGSHTTGSDALFCGVPLLTVQGSTFAGRVGASLCHAVGLPGLVTDSLVSYIALAANLAGDRDRLAQLRHHLEQGRGRLPLHDTEGFTRAFESALIALADRHAPR